MKKIKFPPKVTHGPKVRFSIDGTKGYTNLDGTPKLIPLQRLDRNDNTIRGALSNECCNCASVHLYTFEVFEQKGEFFLQKRGYQIKDGKKVK